MTRATVVGSGPNGLAAALTLADAGLDVTVLEANDVIGGGTRSSELTVPGLIHDECSGFHPLSVDNPFTRQFPLTDSGLTWRWPAVQYAHPLAGGQGAAAWQSVATTAESLGGDGARWQSLFGSLADRFDGITEDFLQPMLHLPRHPVQLARIGSYSALSATLLARRFAAPEAKALFAGVAAHALRPLGTPFSAAIGVALATAAHRYGWPVAEGGSQAIATAMVGRLDALGVKFETGVRVGSVAELDAPDVVLLDVAPAAAVAMIGDRLPARVRRGLLRYRHGPGAFKVDFAVQGGVPWSHEPSRLAGTVHLGGSIEEIAASERMVHQGRMPERPFVLVGQQYLADPTRSKDDVHPVYAYAHVPAGYPGDASAAIEAQLERFAPGFRDRIIARHVRSVAGLQEHNANYVGGDIVTGANDPRQLVFRPRVALDPYALGVPNLYLCSAATPPGAGAHGMCGYNAANSALARLRA